MNARRPHPSSPSRARSCRDDHLSFGLSFGLSSRLSFRLKSALLARLCVGLCVALCVGLCVGLITGCDDEPSPSPEPDALVMMSEADLGEPDALTPDFEAPDVGEPDALTPDFGEPDVGEPDMELTFDLSVPEGAYEQRPAPTERLLAGYAERSLGFPLGSAIVGFGAVRGVTTPFAQSYPGTDTQHTDLTARALVLRQGERALVLVRVEMIGVWQDFIVDLQRELIARGRGDLADGLIIGATHTHASGGRVFDHRIGAIAVGPFLPEFYTRYRRAVLGAILDADEASFEAKVGYDVIEAPSLHNDRRCENGPLQDDRMGLLKVTDERGELKALMVNYAMHGTIVSNSELMLSSDAPGAIERGVAARLPTNAPVLYFQSWAGDMSPNVPHDHIAQGDDEREDFKALDAIGAEAARLIVPAVERVSTSSSVELMVKTFRFPMSNERINPDGFFDRFPYGGTFCMPAEDNCEAPQRVYQPEDLRCLPIPEAWSIGWGQVSVVSLREAEQREAGRGGLMMVTLPGEPLTSVGLELTSRVQALSGSDHVWLLGYAQGYLAYLLHPDDYVLGGYEAQGSLWGPGFGQFLIERGVEAAAHLLNPATPLSFRPLELPELPAFEERELRVERALNAPAWSAQPSLDGQVWRARWFGGDPATDEPRVTIEREEQGEGGALSWVTHTHASGLPWSSAGGELQLSLSVSPSYDEALELEERAFEWRVSLPNVYAVTPSSGQLSGRFRLIVRGTLPEPYELISEPFNVAAR